MWLKATAKLASIETKIHKTENVLQAATKFHNALKVHLASIETKIHEAAKEQQEQTKLHDALKLKQTRLQGVVRDKLQLHTRYCYRHQRKTQKHAAKMNDAKVNAAKPAIEAEVEARAKKKVAVTEAAAAKVQAEKAATDTTTTGACDEPDHISTMSHHSLIALRQHLTFSLHCSSSRPNT